MASALFIDKIRLEIFFIVALLVALLSTATAQVQTAEQKSSVQGRVIVVGEGSVTVTPDYARIRSGVSTSGKTIKEASDSDAKLMAGVIAALADAGIAKKDFRPRNFRSSRFTHRPRRLAGRSFPAIASPTRST
jgi:hypothetical protein